jgi:photoactive yellow protein
LRLAANVAAGRQEEKQDTVMATVDFEAPDLAAAVEQLTEQELDHLPFGVIRLDRDGIVMFYSETEGRLSGYAPRTPLGQNFFEASRCMNTDEFRGRIVRGMQAGKVDLELGWSGDFSDPTRDLRIRVQSSKAGGVWLFIERDAVKPGREREPGPHVAARG